MSRQRRLHPDFGIKVADSILHPSGHSFKTQRVLICRIFDVLGTDTMLNRLNLQFTWVQSLDTFYFYHVGVSVHYVEDTR